MGATEFVFYLYLRLSSYDLVEYEFKSEKFKLSIDRLKIKKFRPKWKHNGIQTRPR